MNTTEIKENFHNLIDNIENEGILLRFYELMKRKTLSKDGRLWANLTPAEKDELLLSYEESEDTENLVSNEEMKNKHKKWL